MRPVGPHATDTLGVVVATPTGHAMVDEGRSRDGPVEVTPLPVGGPEATAIGATRVPVDAAVRLTGLGLAPNSLEGVSGTPLSGEPLPRKRTGKTKSEGDTPSTV